MEKNDFYKLISKICRQEINDKTNLFDLGLSSLNIIKLVNEINVNCNSRINFKDVINADTVLDLFEIVQKNIKVEVCADKKEKTERLTSLQKAYIFGRQKGLPLGGISPHIYFEYDTDMGAETLKTRLKEIIKNNKILRSTFNAQAEMFVKKRFNTDKVVHFNTEYNNLKNYRKKHQYWNFDISKWPLFRFEYFKKKENVYHVCFDTDLLIFDVKSISILFKQIYSENFTKENLLKNDFQTSNENMKFWDNFNCDTPVPDICNAKNYMQISNPTFKNKHLEIPLSDLNQIIDECKKYHIRLSIYLLYCYARVLNKWNNNDQCVINLTTFNEFYSESINDTTKIALIKTDYNLESFNWKKLKEFQNYVLDSIEHAKNIESLSVLRNALGSSNLIQAPVVFTSYLQKANTIIDGSKFFIKNISNLRTQTPQVFLDCQMYIIDEKLNINWDYVSEVLDKELSSEMFKEFVYLIKSGFKKRCDDYTSFFDKKVEKVGKKTLLQNFNHLPQKIVDKVAIVDTFHTIKYKDLYYLVSRMATFLRTNYGIQRGDNVVIKYAKNIESVVTILTIVYMGATYIPVDRDIPTKRLQEIVDETNPKQIINPSSINFNKIKDYRESPMNVRPKDNAYIIYTSGSTGAPKGVVVSNAAANNTIENVLKTLHLASKDVFLNVAAFSFDLSVFDIFGSIMCGATLVLNDNPKNVERIANLISKYKVSFWNSVPFEMEMLLEYQNKINYPSVKNIILSGDKIPINLPSKISKSFVNARIFSFGGATEAGIWSIYYEINDLSILQKYNSVPYGKALPHQQVYVLDKLMKECSPGKIGEIYITGNSLAEGYYKKVKKTNENFFKVKGLGRVYKTGDLGEYSKNKLILFKGRKDRQVKIKGFRVELQEIECRLLQISKIKNAVVLNIDNSLVAFCVLKSNLNSEYIINKLSSYLPKYMIPRYYLFLNNIPQTKNGKIDYKLLENIFNNRDVRKNIKENNKLVNGEDIEKWLQKIINEKLSVQVSYEDSFLELGEDSIVLIDLFNEIKKKYSNLKLIDIFENPTISQLAKFIRSKGE